MKKITIVVVAIMFCFTSWGQIWQIAACSDLGSNIYGPMNSATAINSTNRTAVIYPASQLNGVAGQILTSMYFKRTGTAAMAGTPNFKIYLKEVTAANWGTTALDWATGITGAVLVYDSNPSVAIGASAGWKPFVFSTNFTYGGVQNLAVFMEYTNSTALTTSIQWNYEFTAPCVDIAISTTTKYSNNSTGVLPTSLGSQDYRRPLIGFDVFSTCPPPNAVVVSNITSSGVNINWVAGAAETAWEYLVLPAANTLPNIGTAVTVASATVTGLSNNTLYKVLVRAVCSPTDKSLWRDGGTFRTLCDPQIEFVETFDSYPSTGTAFYADCWGKSNMTGSVYLTTGGITPGSAPNRLYMNCAATTTAVAVLPSVSNLQANTHRLVFKSYATTTLKTIDVGYLTNPSDIASFVVIQNVALASAVAANATTQTVVPTGIPAGVTSLAFRIAGSATTAYLDDVKWEPNTTCIEPTALVATGITTTTAQIDWTEPAVPAANGYDFFRSTSPTAPLSTATPTGSIGAGFNSTVLNGLAPSTVYYVWVRSRCSASVRSPWSSGLTFLTNCTDLTTFSQNFDAALTFPTCWKKLGAGGNGSISAIAAVTAPNSLFLNSTGTLVTQQGLIIMPPVSNAGAGTHRLTFRARGSSTAGGIIQVGYVTDNFDSNTFTSVQSFTTTSITTFDSFSAILGNAPGANKFLAFRHSGANTFAVLIDNVVWEPIPNCIEPSLLTSSAITNTSATISWTEPLVPAGIGYQYFLSTTNIAPSTASVATGSVAVGISTLNLTALPAQTTHFVWVRSVCTASDSSAWTPSITFTTACNPIASFPWLENFDTSATGVGILSACWNRAGTSANVYNTTGSVAPMSPANRLYMNIAATTTAFAILPPFSNLQAGTYRLKFKGYATATAKKVQVGYFTNSSDVNTFTLIQEYDLPSTAATTAVEFTLNLTALPSGVSNLVLTLPFGSATTAYFDDFKYELVPSCLETNNPVVSAITSATATVTWTAPASVPANGYEYFLSTTNVAPSAASTATGATAAGITTVNLTALNSATNYFVWIRSVCTTSDKSEWSGAGSFTTICVASTTFTQNFDAATTFPVCWAKVGTPGTANIQTNNAFSPSNCLYMFGSSTTTQPVVAMMPVSNAGAGTHWLKFKLRASNTVGGIVQVGYLTNPTDITTFVSVLSFTTNSITVYQDIEANLGTAPGANQVLAFRALGVPGNSVLIDNVSWEALPSCASPTALVASAITTTVATVSWTAPITVPANGYQYFISTTNVTPAATATPTGSTAAGVTTVNLASLASSTSYFIWVRSVCSAIDSSSWSSALSFATACGTATTPFAENFESAVVPNLPNCSTAINAGNGNNWTVVANPGYGFTSKTLQYLYNNTIAANAWFFTRGIDMTAGVQYKLNYRYGNNSTIYTEKLKVAYGTAATVAAMTVQLADHNTINTGVPVTAPQVAFTPSTTGIYFFGFNVYSDANQFSLYVDDIAIETVLSNNEFDNGKFTYYPNPVKDILNLGYNQNITNVAVFNLLGQQVITKTVNANQSKIDMSNLSAGTYLVKTTADNQTKTIKVIKE